MSARPLILIAPDVARRGAEFGDLSVSLSVPYARAVEDAGGLPLLLPLTTSREAIADCVSRSHGVVLTGGGDVAPRLHTERVPKKLRHTVEVCPDGGQRDFRELLLIDEIFRQHKPLLAICRGLQILNVALGGTLLVNIPRQVPTPSNTAAWTAPHSRCMRCNWRPIPCWPELPAHTGWASTARTTRPPTASPSRSGRWPSAPTTWWRPSS